MLEKSTAILVSLMIMGCVPDVPDIGDADEVGDADKSDGGGDGGSDTGGDGGDGGSSSGDGGGDGDSDTDTDTDSGYPDAPYVGWESFDYSDGTDAPSTDGYYECQVAWEMVGSPTELLCIGCEFSFDVDATLMETVSHDDTADGDCADLMSDWSAGYGYTADYYGYGPLVMYGPEGYGVDDWSAWTDATFEDGTFTYVSGEKDYYYDGAGGYYPELAGKYFTNYWYGTAEISGDGGGDGGDGGDTGM